MILNSLICDPVLTGTNSNYGIQSTCKRLYGAFMCVLQHSFMIHKTTKNRPKAVSCCLGAVLTTKPPAKPCPVSCRSARRRSHRLRPASSPTRPA